MEEKKEYWNYQEKRYMYHGQIEDIEQQLQAYKDIVDELRECIGTCPADNDLLDIDEFFKQLSQILNKEER